MVTPRYLAFLAHFKYLSVDHVCILDNRHLIGDSVVFALVWVEIHLPVSLPLMKAINVFL